MRVFASSWCVAQHPRRTGPALQPQLSWPALAQNPHLTARERTLTAPQPQTRKMKDVDSEMELRDAFRVLDQDGDAGEDLEPASQSPGGCGARVIVVRSRVRVQWVRVRSCGGYRGVSRRPLRAARAGLGPPSLPGANHAALTRSGFLVRRERLHHVQGDGLRLQGAWRGPGLTLALTLTLSPTLTLTLTPSLTLTLTPTLTRCLARTWTRTR